MSEKWLHISLEITNNIEIYVFNSFAFYTIFVLLYSVFNRNFFKRSKFDERAVKFVAVSGIVYALFYGIQFYDNFTSAYFYEEFSYHKRNGWLSLLIAYYPILFILLTQFLRFKWIRESVVARLLIAFFLIFTMERLLIILTGFHSDFLPTSWTYLIPDVPIWMFGLGFMLKMVLFFIYVQSYHVIKKQLSKLYYNFKLNFLG